jgi:hypothetical protein
LEKALDMEDMPSDHPKKVAQKRDWKQLPKTDLIWDPFEELKIMMMDTVDNEDSKDSCSNH